MKTSMNILTFRKSTYQTALYPCYYVVIVNDITNFCFRLLQEPYTVAPARPKTKFLMSLTIDLPKRMRPYLENEISNVVNYRFTEKKEAVPYESS